MAIRKLLKAIEWQYYVYEDDNNIELSVPIPKPTPGFDVTYTLNQNEKEEYLSSFKRKDRRYESKLL